MSHTRNETPPEMVCGATPWQYSKITDRASVPFNVVESSSEAMPWSGTRRSPIRAQDSQFCQCYSVSKSIPVYYARACVGLLIRSCNYAVVFLLPTGEMDLRALQKWMAVTLLRRLLCDPARN